MVKPFEPKTIEYAHTPNGTLRGFCQRGIYNFLGVKYGEVKRWHRAEPVKPWKGIKNAVQFGNVNYPMRPFTPLDSCGLPHELYAYDEDCLNLNIWTPSLDKDAKKPVMFWIHGGAFIGGFVMEMQCHDGESMATFGDVVVVGVNHRLGLHGFLDVTRFGEEYEGSANLGITDLVAALKWVKENIASFGGDPDNVTIFGQSGGGMKVTTLMQTPEADGLFHKAIVMSGSPAHESDETNEYITQLVDDMIAKAGGTGIEALEALTQEELLDLYKETVKGKKLPDMMGFRPIADGWYVGNPLRVGYTEHAKTIPLMIGCTISEGPLMRIFNKHDYTEEQREEIVRASFPGQDADKLMELFRAAWPEKVVTDVIEMTGNLNFRPVDIRMCDLRAQTCSAPTYSYILGHDFPQDGGRGAWHCADIPLVFRNASMHPDNFKNGAVGALEDAMCAAWVSFAHTGNPNNEYLGVQWPEYKADDCATLIFDETCTVRKNFDRELIAMRNAMELKVDDKYTQFTQLIN